MAAFVIESVLESHFNSSCMSPVKMVFTQNRIFTELKCFFYTHIASNWCVHFLFVEFLSSSVLKKFYPIFVKLRQFHLLSFKTFNRYLLFIIAWKISVFGVFLVHIQSKCGKIRTSKSQNMDNFYSVLLTL